MSTVSGGPYLKRGLINYWPMNGSSIDVIGANDGVDTSINYVDGKVEECADFNGATSEIDISTITITTSDKNTISLWFNTNSFPLVLLTGVPGGQPYIGAITTTQSYLSCVSPSEEVFFSFNFSTGIWYNHVWVFNNGTIKLFVNGVESITGVKSFTGQFYFNKIGGYNAGYDINGLVDEIAVWNRVLSENEILGLYNNGIGIKIRT